MDTILKMVNAPLSCGFQDPRGCQPTVGASSDGVSGQGPPNYSGPVGPVSLQLAGRARQQGPVGPTVGASSDGVGRRPPTIANK